MSKSVYSVVLMDDVVDAVDRLAYEAGTNRSNMINRILAEYVQLATPEQRMQDIFSSIMDAVSGQNALQLMLNASDAMLSMRSAIHYKYNPSMRYVVELYPHSNEELGEVRAGLRTQNPSASFISCGPGWSARIWKARRAAARRREGGIPAACFCPGMSPPARRLAALLRVMWRCSTPA